MILPEFLKLGEARLKTAILGKIFSSNLHRCRGIGSRIIKDALNYIEKQRFNFSFVFKVSRIYQRFGFTPTFFEHYFDFKVRKKNIQKFSSNYDYRIRRMRPSDIPVIQKIHDASEEQSSCSLLRTQLHYSLRWNQIKNTLLIYDILGKIKGYFCFDIEWKQIMTIREIGCLSRNVFEPLLYYLLKWAEKFDCDYIRLLVPPNFEMLNWFKEVGIPLSSCSVSRSPVGLVNIHNLEETLQCLTPEWEKLLHNSILKNKEVELTLLVDSFPINIFARKGDILISNRISKNKITMSRDELTVLILGFESGEDFINEGIIGVNEEGKQLLKILFPKRIPYIWYLDRL